MKINPYQNTKNMIQTNKYSTTAKYYQFDGNFSNSNNNFTINTYKILDKALKKKYSYEYEMSLERFKNKEDVLITGTKKIPSINYDGKYDNNTDFQICNFACINQPHKFSFLISAYNILEKKYLSEDKTFNEFYLYLLDARQNATGEELELLNEAKNVLWEMIENGYGEYSMYYGAHSSNGLDYLIMKDKEGNYIINFPCTEGEFGGDWIADADNFINGRFAGQEKIAKDISDKIYNKAKEEGKSVHISGYSLGGGLAEYVYLDLIKQNGMNDETIGDLSVYEPFHYNMTSEESEIIKDMWKKDKVNMYAASGSLISSITAKKQLTQVTKYLDVDYKKQYANAELADYLTGGAHKANLPNEYKNKNFNHNGKYIKNIKFTENGYNADYITAEEICDNNPLLKIVYDFIYGTEKLGSFGALHETKFVMKGQD